MSRATQRSVWSTFVSENSPDRNNDRQESIVARNTSGNAVRSYIYFSTPFPLGATIKSAKFYMYTKKDKSGNTSVTATLQRMASSIKFSKITWKTRTTSVLGNTASITRTSVGKYDEWAFDITSQMQAVSDGGKWYGMHLTSNWTGATSGWYPEWFSEDSTTSAAMRPRVDFEWSDAPEEPTKLSPSGDRWVGNPNPTLRFDFKDLSGDKDMGGARVQVFNKEQAITANLIHDSQPFQTSEPEYKLPFTLTQGQKVWWRVMVQDGAGLWSGWSAVHSFGYKALPTVIIQNPALLPPETRRTNYVHNPEFQYTNTSGFSGATFAALPATENGLMRITVTSPTATLFTYTQPTLPPAGTITYRMKVRGSAAGSPTTIGKVFRLTMTEDRNGSPTTVGTSSNVTLTNSWQTVTVSGTHASNGTNLRVAGSVTTSTWEVGQIVEVDGHSLLVGTASTAPLFFSGADGTTNLYDYAWTGTAGSSTSIEREAVASYVNDPTPGILWQVTSGTQAFYEIIIDEDANRLTTLPFSAKRIYTTGKVKSATADGWRLPAGLIKYKGENYRVTMRVWDNEDREAVPETNIYGYAARNFTYEHSTASLPVQNLVATPSDPYPGITLTWTRGTTPDSYAITRDGRTLASNLDPDALLGSGQTTSYTWFDPFPVKGKNHVYSIQAVTENKASASNPTATAKNDIFGTWLVDADYPTDSVMIVNDKGRTLEFTEQSDVFDVLGSDYAILVTQGLQGYRGSITGELHSGVTPRSAEFFKNELLRLKRRAGQTIYLFIQDMTIPVVLQNVQVAPKPQPGARVYTVSFDFYQVGDISFSSVI